MHSRDPRVIYDQPASYQTKGSHWFVELPLSWRILKELHWKFHKSGHPPTQRMCANLFVFPLWKQSQTQDPDSRMTKENFFFCFFFCFDIETYCGKRMDWYLHLITSLGFPLEKYHPHPPEMIVPDISIHKKCKKKNKNSFLFQSMLIVPINHFVKVKRKRAFGGIEIKEH